MRPFLDSNALWHPGALWHVAGRVAPLALLVACSLSAPTSDSLDEPQTTIKPALTASCFGESAPITIAHGLPFAKVSVGSKRASGYFLLDYATTESAIDLTAFAGLNGEAINCNPNQLGAICGFSDFDFFGGWGPVSFVTEDLSGFQGTVREGGILGTDFLADVIVTVDYAHRKAYVALEGEGCSDVALAAEGFVSLLTTGYFSDRSSNLLPLSSVFQDALEGETVPNVPAVPLRVGTKIAFAQLDTGFDDRVLPFSVNVNEAYFKAIVATSPSALVREAGKDLTLTTCAGVAESVEAYTFSPGFAPELIDSSGQSVKRYPSATLFVKRTPAVAKWCGGIGTWDLPAAQIGASFFGDASAMVFDPFASKVWIRTK